MGIFIVMEDMERTTMIAFWYEMQSMKGKGGCIHGHAIFQTYFLHI